MAWMWKWVWMWIWNPLQEEERPCDRLTDGNRRALATPPHAHSLSLSLAPCVALRCVALRCVDLRCVARGGMVCCRHDVLRDAMLIFWRV